MLRTVAAALALPCAVLGATALVGLDVTAALPSAVALTIVWGIFLWQLRMGRSARVYLSYQRFRHGLVMTRGRELRASGARRTEERPRRSVGAPKLAWSHDGWAHADGQLLGLDLLDQHYDVTAFGTESRTRGDPPVTLELLPAISHGDGLRLVGLERALGRFDVVCSGGSFEGTTWQALEARRHNGPPVIAIEYENIAANYQFAHPLRERALSEVDHFCAISAGVARVLELDGVEPERISLVPLVVEMPAFTQPQRDAMRIEGRRRWELEHDSLVVLFIGRTVWDKGLHTLATAISWLAQKPEAERVQWLVAGSGDYLEHFQRIVGHYGARDRVRLIGTVGARDRHLAYCSADLLVLPSNPMPGWTEQFGRVIPEAQHFGLPAVGAASGAIPEVIGDAGLIVPPADHIALSNAVESFIDDRRRAEFAARARRRAGSEYSASTYVSRLEEALERGIERRERVRTVREAR